MFAAACVAYSAFQLLTRGFGYRFPTWVSSWLADALCVPVVLTLALVAQRVLRRQPRFVLPDAWLVASWLYVSLWFELLAPWLLPARYAADGLDVLAYAAGTWAFRRWLNGPGPTGRR
ncbi:hypothetical protein B0919_08440 [Hymenobacter sp. CRA2]|nr:hypothetical protein B0919_08440 [Hymenobacter sp. CRA2]